LLSHLESFMSEELQPSGAELKLKVSPEDLELMADEKLIEQTLINLVKNSIYALEGVKKPVIHCRALKTGSHITIEVSDNGRGVPGEILDTIFTPFFTTRKGGSGIGLSLARQVMQMHNGTINVTSPEGKNTTFTLNF
ncbi:MAG: ATP-binding protein, partial [Bacteroidota bacterium]|nr:ATP-binding protein [Bacteroidota bacterium]